MTSADEKVNFEINGTDLLARDLNIFASTTANHRAILEQLKQMALTNNTTGASIYDLGKLVQSDSIAQMNTVLKEAESKQTQQKQQEQQSAQQMQEQQLASQKEQKQMEIDAEATKEEKNRQRDILVAEIRAAGYGSMSDVNKNMESDYVDAMKEIKSTEQYQEQTNLQREKEVNRMNIDSQKNQIEREKIAAQKEIANKQLQIAQENKNKFDVGSKNKGEKK
jgi:acetoin utilization deacetylase AcuC-like enzyme